MVSREQSVRRIDAPEPCFVRLRLVKNGVWLAARIFRRLGVLVAEINGEPANVFDVWHSGELITEEQWNTMMRNPEPNPRRVIHLSAAGLEERMREQNEVDWWLTRPIR